MNIDVQIVKSDGVPVAAVLPWNEYQRLLALTPTEKNMAPGIPHAVVEMVVAGNSPIKAWRRYLGLTQVQAAAKIGVTQGGIRTDGKDAKQPESDAAKGGKGIRHRV